MYRTIIHTITAFCLFAGSAFAAVPQFINYQGLLQDTAGVPVADGPHLIKFIIWNDPVATTVANEKWSSGFQNITVNDGLFEYQLGSSVPLPTGLFSNDTILYLGVSEGANPEMLPRTKLVSVGYAFHALRTDIADSAAILSDNAVSSVKIADGSILNADINSSAAIDVTKISGTAVNLSSTQTITGAKQFGDSTMIVDNTGIRIGDNGASSSTQLIRVQRNYNATTFRYGYLGILNNQGSGDIIGVYSEVLNNVSTGKARYALYGVSGTSANTSGNSYGVFGNASGGAGSSVFGVYGVSEGNSTNEFAGYFLGNVNVTGTLVKGAGSFMIDHPLDPANKYLVHSFVESPDMMNVYNGNVILDGNGTANVTLPDYFNALNKDYRYQLTSIGAPGPNLYIASEISGNQFVISGGEPNSKVSWQVTGVRKDAYAEAHRIKVEPDKPIAEKGLYLHPVELGLSETKQLHYEMRKNQELERERMANESTQ